MCSCHSLETTFFSISVILEFACTLSENESFTVFQNVLLSLMSWVLILLMKFSFSCLINPKTAEEGVGGGGVGGGQFDPPSFGFSKNISSKERVKPLFVSFNIIVSHIFPENFEEIPQVVQKI